LRTIYQGETLPLETEVFDIEGDPSDLSLATVEFWIKFPDGAKADITPDISGNVASVNLTTDQTTLTGIYTYQFTIELADETKKQLGVFKVTSAVD
jgi:hypothetical protein